MAPVGHGGHHVGHLKRCAAQFALSDRQRDDGQSVPSSPVGLVIKSRFGHVAVQLAREVRAELTAVSEAADVVRPQVEPFVYVAVFLVFDDVAEHVAEISVARVLDRSLQVERRVVLMACHASAVRVSAVTRISLLGDEHAFLQSDQALHDLERRTGRIGRHDGPVEQRPARVVEQLHVVVSPLASDQFVGIVSGAAGHNQYFSRSGLDRDDAAYLALHQLLGERLQSAVDRAGDRDARRGQRVVNAVRIGAFGDTVYVDHFDLDALFSAKHFFVSLLDTAHADVVAAAVVRVALEDAVVDLAHVAQQVACHFGRVGAHRAVDGEETRKAVLLEAQLDLLG